MENNEYTFEDWQYDVANGDTKLGYKDWQEHQKEANPNCICRKGSPYLNPNCKAMEHKD